MILGLKIIVTRSKSRSHKKITLHQNHKLSSFRKCYQKGGISENGRVKNLLKENTDRNCQNQLVFRTLKINQELVVIWETFIEKQLNISKNNKFYSIFNLPFSSLFPQVCSNLETNNPVSQRKPLKKENRVGFLQNIPRELSIANLSVISQAMFSLSDLARSSSSANSPFSWRTSVKNNRTLNLWLAEVVELRQTIGYQHAQKEILEYKTPLGSPDIF